MSYFLGDVIIQLTILLSKLAQKKWGYLPKREKRERKKGEKIRKKECGGVVGVWKVVLCIFLSKKKSTIKKMDKKIKELGNLRVTHFFAYKIAKSEAGEVAYEKCIAVCVTHTLYERLLYQWKKGGGNGKKLVVNNE